MGRKGDLKKIEDVTKRQVTFSKRRSSLIKKANEIAVCCDADVAFVAFSPSGRVSKYCSQKRIEDVLHRYVELPPEMRFPHIENIERKLNRLSQLNNFTSDISKIQYLDKIIENYQLQVKKADLELQLAEANLRNYEVAPDQEPASLHQLSLCEKNLKRSLETLKKEVANMSMSSKQPIEMQMVNQSWPFPSNFNEIGSSSNVQNPAFEEYVMKHDPWLNPYNAKVRENSSKELLEANIATPNRNPGPSNICDFPLPDSLTILESGVPVTFDDQMPVQMAFPGAMHSRTLCNLQTPRLTSATMDTNIGCTAQVSQSLHNEITGLQFPNSNVYQFNNLRGGEATGHLHMNFGNKLNGINSTNESTDVGGSRRQIDCGQLLKGDQIQQITQTQNNFYHDIPVNNQLPQDMLRESKIQKSGSSDWEDLLVDNFSFGDFSRQ